jgi:small-conductance mechanosensitive channel
MYIPLLIASSCVIGASRHENRELIIKEIISNAVRITTFMLVIYAVLQVVSWMV